MPEDFRTWMQTPELYEKMKNNVRELLVHKTAEPFSIEERENVEELVYLIHPFFVKKFLGKRMGKLVSLRR